MSFKYINPGYAGLLKDRYPDKKTDIDATGKSKTGRAFSNTQANEFLIPSTLENDEIWIRFDAYILSNKGTSMYAGEIYGTDSLQNGIWISRSQDYASITMRYSGTSKSLSSYHLETDALKFTGLKLDDLNSFWIHLKHGAAGTGFLEFQINDVHFEKIQDVNFQANSYKRFGFYSNNSNLCFSNIICSDEEISILETIVPASIVLTETDMSFDSDTGIYTASAANQTILQSVDASSLSNEYGSDSTVTGIALIGNPAYKTELGLSKLTAVSKENGIITDYETNSLLEDTSAMILGSRKFENKTMSDLQNIQFGWKSGN